LSIVGLTLLIAGVVAVGAAARVAQLVLASRSDEVRAVRRALVTHGVAWLVLVATALIAGTPHLPLAVAVPAGLMAVSWGVAWVLIGLTYGLGFDAEASSRVSGCSVPSRRFETWARRSVGAHSPPRR
jgi:hypothetical protein